MNKSSLTPLFLVLAACSAPAELPVERAELLHFGTSIQITIRDADTQRARDAIAAADHQLGEWHRRWHAWQPSELTALNACLQKGESCAVAEDLARLLKRSQELATQTDDLFNPAMGKRIAEWGFLRDDMNGDLAAPAQIDPSILPRMSHLQWLDAAKVKSTHAHLSLDLGGIAKGWALNELTREFRARGITSALINLGGDVAAIGDAGGRPWRIGIENHQGGVPLAALSLRDGEMVFSSGDYARKHKASNAGDAKKPAVAHHIIDPRSGAPATGHHLVTLVGADGLLLQAATKALLIAGDDWQAYARKLKLADAFVVDASDRQWASATLSARLEPVADASPQWRVVSLNP